MITRYACTLNGVSLDSLDPCIHITDLTELAPRQRIVTAPSARHGLHVLQRVRESLTVRVRFLIRAYDTVQRRRILQQVCAWASKGGTLTVSDRPGQQLQVICDGLPGMSALTWLDELEISFTACRIPFWESQQRTTAATDSQAALSLPGTADEAPVSCQVVNRGTGTLTSLTLTVGTTSMVFTGLNIASGDYLVMNAEKGVLRAAANGESVLMHRQADSDDYLLAPCGSECTVSVSADQPVTATFMARGRYL